MASGIIDERPPVTEAALQTKVTLAGMGVMSPPLELNPQFTSWAHGHNIAFQKDNQAFKNSLFEAVQAGAAEASIDQRAAAHDAAAVHEKTQRDAYLEDINKNHLPATAKPMGSPVETGPDTMSPIRDINTVSVDGKSWGYVYRTADGNLMVQRDEKSVPGKSSEKGDSVSVAGGAAKGPFTLQVTGTHSYAETMTEPSLQATVRLTDPVKQLPDGATVSPLLDAGGNPVHGSTQLLPVKPHGHENAYDRQNERPPAFDGVSMSEPSGPQHANVAVNRDGVLSVAVSTPGQALEMNRSTADVGRG